MTSTKEQLENKGHPEGLTDNQELLLTQLVEIGAVNFGDFRLKLHETNPEAPLSPIYIDLRTLRRFPEVKRTAISVYEELLQPLKFDLLADVPTAGTPFVSSLSDKLNVGVITPRSDKKTHGTGTKIDGMLAEDTGKTAVLIDDLVTHAESKLEAAEILRQEGIQVEDVVVLIDRGQGGKEQLEQAGLRLHSAITLDQMLKYYQRNGILTPDKYESIKTRLEQINAYFLKESPHRRG